MSEKAQNSKPLILILINTNGDNLGDITKVVPGNTVFLYPTTQKVYKNFMEVLKKCVKNWKKPWHILQLFILKECGCYMKVLKCKLIAGDSMNIIIKWLGIYYICLVYLDVPKMDNIISEKHFENYIPRILIPGTKIMVPWLLGTYYPV